MPRVLLWISLAFWPLSSTALPAGAGFVEAEQRGSATVRLAGVALYDARLFTPGGAPLSWDRDLALELTYRRGFSRQALVNSTLDEFSRIGGPLPVRADLGTCFADVQEGHRFVAASQGPDRLRFWLNGQQTCTLTHPNIRKRFLEIFVGRDTRSAMSSKRLRGE